MKRDKSSSVVLSSLVVLLILCAAFSMMSVEARKNRHAKKPRTPPHKLKKERSNYPGKFPAPAPAPTQLPPGCYPSPSNVFDILSFGAKGDGVSDDSKVIRSIMFSFHACNLMHKTVSTSILSFFFSSNKRNV